MKFSIGQKAKWKGLITRSVYYGVIVDDHEDGNLILERIEDKLYYSIKIERLHPVSEEEWLRIILEQ